MIAYGVMEKTIMNELAMEIAEDAIGWKFRITYFICIGIFGFFWSLTQEWW